MCVLVFDTKREDVKFVKEKLMCAYCCAFLCVTQKGDVEFVRENLMRASCCVEAA